MSSLEVTVKNKEIFREALCIVNNERFT